MEWTTCCPWLGEGLKVLNELLLSNPPNTVAAPHPQVLHVRVDPRRAPAAICAAGRSSCDGVGQ
eukprot:8027406-Pyramimonas_sp.AAC.1